MVVKNYRWDDGAWRVYKWINGKIHYFGRYENEAQAIEKVDHLRKNNWDGLISPKKRKVTFPFEEDEKLIDKIAIERNIQAKTKATYCQSVIHYTEYLKQSFTSLIEIYYAEEETTPWKKRTLKKHLIGFRNHLYNTYLRGTAKNYFSRLLTVFRHLEIELNYLPMLNTKNIKEAQPITHSDLTRDFLKQNDYNKELYPGFRSLAEYIIRLIDDIIPYTMFNGNSNTVNEYNILDFELIDEDYYYQFEGKYHVSKLVDGEPKYYGEYDSEEEAKEIVEVLKLNQWDESVLSELKGVIF